MKLMLGIIFVALAPVEGEKEAPVFLGHGQYLVAYPIEVGCASEIADKLRHTFPLPTAYIRSLDNKVFAWAAPDIQEAIKSRIRAMDKHGESSYRPPQTSRRPCRLLRGR